MDNISLASMFAIISLIILLVMIIYDLTRNESSLGARKGVEIFLILVVIALNFIIALTKKYDNNEYTNNNNNCYTNMVTEI